MLHPASQAAGWAQQSAGLRACPTWLPPAPPPFPCCPGQSACRQRSTLSGKTQGTRGQGPGQAAAAPSAALWPRLASRAGDVCGDPGAPPLGSPGNGPSASSRVTSRSAATTARPFAQGQTKGGGHCPQGQWLALVTAPSPPVTDGRPGTQAHTPISPPVSPTSPHQPSRRGRSQQDGKRRAGPPMPSPPGASCSLCPSPGKEDRGH